MKIKFLNWLKYKMPVDIKSVLVCDAVDNACIEFLQANGIKVKLFWFDNINGWNSIYLLKIYKVV